MTTGQPNEMRQNGFTLLELMITVAIAAILLAVAIPSFQSVMSSNRITSQTNNFLADLALARNEALKRGIPVSVCSSANITAASPTCAGSTDWSTGWIVFTDTSTGTVGGYDAGTDTLLRVGDALRGAVTLNNTNNFVRYTPSGAVTAVNTFTLCRSGVTGRTISIIATGRVSTQNTAGICP